MFNNDNKMKDNLNRIIDANYNRVSEGLRVLEDIARMILNDAVLSKKLKSMRHKLRDDIANNIELISHRDAENDVGSGLEPLTEQSDLVSIVRANSRRIEEGLRVLEEVSKLPDVNISLRSNEFKQSRFEIYTLEREIASKVLRKDKTKYIHGLYVVLDTAAIGNRNIIDITKQIIKGGVKIIQLRDKRNNKADLIRLAKNIQEICHEFGVLFIINDYLDITIAVGADGLHVGQEDLPVAIARVELPIDKIIGCSVNTLSQAKQAMLDGADYVAAGSMFPTQTKKDVHVTGLDLLAEIKNSVPLPLVAIGGINISNVPKVLAKGADAVAVVSAILSQDDIQEATRKFIAAIS